MAIYEWLEGGSGSKSPSMVHELPNAGTYGAVHKYDQTKPLEQWSLKATGAPADELAAIRAAWKTPGGTMSFTTETGAVTGLVVGFTYDRIAGSSKYNITVNILEDL